MARSRSTESQSRIDRDTRYADPGNRSHVSTRWWTAAYRGSASPHTLVAAAGHLAVPALSLMLSACTTYHGTNSDAADTLAPAVAAPDPDSILRARAARRRAADTLPYDNPLRINARLAVEAQADGAAATYLLTLDGRSVIHHGPPQSIRVDLTVRNTGRKRVTLETYRECPAHLVIDRDSLAATARPRRGREIFSGVAWSGSIRWSCALIGLYFALEPGESRILSTHTWTAKEILGDSLPPGRYFLTAVTDLNGEFLAAPAGAVELREP